MIKKNSNRLFLTFFYFFLHVIFYTISLSTPLENSKNLKTGVLNNGITYYMYKNEYPKDKIFMNLVVNSGSLEESPSQEGTAHFLEHMAFNGTKSYPKNDLVKFLQSIGLKFGDDLNAYTSYGETVYSLDTPSIESDIDICLNILNQWAFYMSLTPEDVKDEKNIIIEEWRLKQGLKFRISDLKRKALFGDSIFYTNLPIGTQNSINNISPEILRGYYEKFYTPNRMALIVVGDFDESKMEDKIKAIFSSDYNGLTPPEQVFDIPKTKNQTIIFRDKEIVSSNLSLNYSKHLNSINSKTNLKEALIQHLFFNIFNNRMENLIKKENSPFISGKIYSYPFTKGYEMVELTTAIKDNQIDKAYRDLFVLLKASSIYPPYSDELENEKKDLLASLKMMLNNKNSIDNKIITDEIKDTFLLGDTFLSIEDEYPLVNEAIFSVTPGDILNFAKLFYEAEKLKFLTIPDSETSKSLVPEHLEKIEKDISHSTPFNSEYIPNKELDKPVLTSGDIISKKIINENTPFEYCEYILSNNIKVIYKKTDFENDKIYINFFNKVGTSVDDKESYYNALFVPYMMSKSGVGNLNPQEFSQFIKGKNYTFSIDMDDYTHGVEILSDNENLENAINTLDSLVLSPRFDDIIFNSLKEIYKEKITNQENSPLFQFNKSLTSTFFLENYRRMPLTLSDLSFVNKEGIIRLYKEKFSNFSNFNLIILGAVDEQTVETLLKNNFASLPSEKSSETFLPLKIELQNKEITKTVIKGDDEKATVTLIYPYNGLYNNNNRNLYNAFSSLLDILLIEKIRESSAQVYSIYSSPNLEYSNFGENYLTVNFSTDYKKVDEVIKNVKSSIESITKGEYDPKKIDDIIENYEINYNTQLKMNKFWYTYLSKKSFSENSDYSVLTPKEFRDLVKYGTLKKFATEHIKNSNCTTIILKPEKDKK